MRTVPLALSALVISALSISVQAQAPASEAPAAPAAQSAPAAPGTQSASADPFPAVDQAYFTAKSPSIDTVNSFLKALWGYDTNRLWKVMAIQSTQAPDVAKVVVFVTEKGENAKMQSATLYVLPDGKHALVEGSGVISFGADPFADLRNTLRERANGASRGAASKNFELVEFADLQCPHCKDAQPIMDQLAKDFPNAHIVFQHFPLVQIHPSAFKAAAYGVCVQQQSNDAFFKYAAKVFDTQDSLMPGSDDDVLKAAVTSAGLDPNKVAACSESAATKATVDGDIKLADEVGADQTPLLSVNGRMLPITDMPYEQVKAIVEYQAQLDHVATGANSGAVASSTPKHPGE